MNALNRGGRWLFAPMQQPTRWWQVIAWWELRRIPFNLFIGLYGVVCLLLFYWAVDTSGRIKPDDDAFNPFVLVFVFPFAANAFYTLGWIVELAARRADPALASRFSPLLMKAGLAFSLFLISMPVVFWMGILLLQTLHVIR